MNNSEIYRGDRRGAVQVPENPLMEKSHPLQYLCHKTDFGKDSYDAIEKYLRCDPYSDNLWGRDYVGMSALHYLCNKTGSECYVDETYSLALIPESNLEFLRLLLTHGANPFHDSDISGSRDRINAIGFLIANNRWAGVSFLANYVRQHKELMSRVVDTKAELAAFVDRILAKFADDVSGNPWTLEDCTDVARYPDCIDAEFNGMSLLEHIIHGHARIQAKPCFGLYACKIIEAIIALGSDPSAMKLTQAKTGLMCALYTQKSHYRLYAGDSAPKKDRSLLQVVIANPGRNAIVESIADVFVRLLPASIFEKDTDPEGNSLLHLAAVSFQENICTSICERFPSLMARKNKEGLTAEKFAEENGGYRSANEIRAAQNKTK